MKRKTFMLISNWINPLISWFIYNFFGALRVKRFEPAFHSSGNAQSRCRTPPKGPIVCTCLEGHGGCRHPLCPSKHVHKTRKELLVCVRWVVSGLAVVYVLMSACTYCTEVYVPGGVSNCQYTHRGMSPAEVNLKTHSTNNGVCAGHGFSVNARTMRCPSPPCLHECAPCWVCLPDWLWDRQVHACRIYVHISRCSDDGWSLMGNYCLGHVVDMVS